MQSLADYLGTAPPKPEQVPALQVYDFATTTAKEFAEAVLNSQEFRRYIIHGLTLGELPPAVITRLMDYAWGKPVERIEMRDTTSPLDALTEEQLEARALQLAEMARQMREAREEHSNTRLSDSIH